MPTLTFLCELYIPHVHRLPNLNAVVASRPHDMFKRCRSNRYLLSQAYGLFAALKLSPKGSEERTLLLHWLSVYVATLNPTIDPYGDAYYTAKIKRHGTKIAKRISGNLPTSNPAASAAQPQPHLVHNP